LAKYIFDTQKKATGTAMNFTSLTKAVCKELVEIVGLMCRKVLLLLFFVLPTFLTRLLPLNVDLLF
jgi:hypothetical protein